MAKFTTNVAGVTHYNVDFESIRKSSKVEIIPEPECPYDENALRVIIDGRHVGYIKKGFNRGVLNEIESGNEVIAKVKAVVGQDKDNCGIVLTLTVNDKDTFEVSDRNLGHIKPGKRLEFTTVRAPLPKIDFFKGEELWERFLEEKHGLPKATELPKEPDYQKDYDSKFPWWRRLWSETYESYYSRSREAWLKSCAEPELQNKNRTKILRQLNSQHHKSSEEYETYLQSVNLAKLLSRIKATINESDDTFQTVYERIIYNMLKPHVKYIFHQARIDKKSIDLLCILEDFSAAWAIEIDGGVHLRQRKIDRDHATEDVLRRSGVELLGYFGQVAVVG